MKAICLPRRNRSSFWAFCCSRLTFFLNWEFWMILFRAEAILRVQHLEVWKILSTNWSQWCDSSTESTISTSLIHNIASDWKSEQAVTSVEKENFPNLKWLSIMEFVSDHAVLRYIHRNCRTHSHWLCCKMSALELCLDFVCLHSCEWNSSFRVQ